MSKEQKAKKMSRQAERHAKEQENEWTNLERAENEQKSGEKAKS